MLDPSMVAAVSAPPSLDVFRHANAERGPLYRAILACFVAAKERFALHLRPREIASDLIAVGVVASDEELEAALDQLVGWGNLRAFADTAEVATVEEFRRKRRLFALTREGAGAERALREFERYVGTPGELKAAALEDIEEHLTGLVALVTGPTFDGDKAYRLLEALRGRFADLTEQAQVFVTGLRRAVDLHDVEESIFLAYKERLVDYLSGFIGALTVRQAAIGALLEQLKGEPLEHLLDAAAAREMVDRLDKSAVLERELRDVWESRWRGLRGWFLPEDGAPPQAQRLHHFALDAIPALLRTIGHLNDRRVQRSDRREDFRTLARWFAEGDEDDAHRLARAAFGMSPARHLSVNDETLAAWDAAEVSGRTAWAEAPPLRITPRMRQTGSHRKPGRREKVVDRREAKEALARLAASEADELEAIRRRLDTGGRVRLSSLGVLDRGAFALLLDLLGAAYAARESDNSVMEAFSADGAVRIVLEPVADGSQARIETSEGVLIAPECWVTIHGLTTNLNSVGP